MKEKPPRKKLIDGAKQTKMENPRTRKRVRATIIDFAIKKNGEIQPPRGEGIGMLGNLNLEALEIKRSQGPAVWAPRSAPVLSD